MQSQTVRCSQFEANTASNLSGLFPNFGQKQWVKTPSGWKLGGGGSYGGDLTFQGTAQAGSDNFGGNAWGHDVGDVVASNSAYKASSQSGNSIFTVTNNGIVLPKGAKIPSNLIENPNRSGSYGTMQNNKFIEKLRLDSATPINKKGPGVSHFHLDGKKEHIFDISKWPWWQK